MSLKSLLLEQIMERTFETVFLGTLILGEPFFLISSFLLAGNLNNLFHLALGGFLANIIYDLFFFSLPNLKILNKIKIPVSIKIKYKKINKKIKSIEKKDTLLVLLSSKFLIGTRNITLFSLGSNRIKLKKFLFESVISSLIWVFMIVILGILTNKGFILINESSQGIARILISAGFLIIILLIILKRYFHIHLFKLIRKKHVTF